MTRTLPVALGVLLSASIAGAQTVPQTFDAAPVEEPVEGVLPGGEAEMKSRVEGFDQGSIARWINGQRTLRRNEIAPMPSQDDSTLDGLILGAVLGLYAGAGFAVFAPIGPCDGTPGSLRVGCLIVSKALLAAVCAPAGMVIGAAAGVGIDALLQRRSAPYERGRRLKIGLAPIVGRERQGVSMSVGW